MNFLTAADAVMTVMALLLTLSSSVVIWRGGY